MRLRLTFLLPADETGGYTSQGTTVQIGRAPQCDLRLPDGYASVSWEHARIDLLPDGAQLQDLGSTNGTYLNGRRVGSGVGARLKLADQIQFGQTGPILRVAELDLTPPTHLVTAVEKVKPLALTPAGRAYEAAAADPFADLGRPDPPAPAAPNTPTRRMLQQSQRNFRILAAVAAGGAFVVVAAAVAVVTVVLMRP